VQRAHGGGLVREVGMEEGTIRDFWAAHPCGEVLVGGIQGDYERFFKEYDEYRYKHLDHIPGCLDRIGFGGKKVLEIGLGLGADSEQIIRRGGRYSGLDLTKESIERVATRFRLRNLAYDELKVGSALEIPFEDNSFDIVFSHGVLHHIPDIATAQREIARVLKPGGMLVAMLYAKYSMNYLVSISVARRAALAALVALRVKPGGKVGKHVENARRLGLFEYLKDENFLGPNTDGPENPYSKVYDVAEVRKVFADFEVVKTYKNCMHAPPFPVKWLPLGGLLGWCLWAHMVPRGK